MAGVEGAPLPGIEIADLCVRRGSATVLRNVQLAVPRGAIHAVVGPNGGGKSTLLGAIEGRLAFEGRIHLHVDPGGGRALGVVPQKFKVDPSLPLRADEFLALQRQRWPVVLGLRQAVRRSVTASLEAVGMAGLGHSLLSEISGGQLQRILLAQAIDPPPQILLLDEPTTGLDPDALQLLEAKALALRKEHGTTLVWVTHDLEQVQRVADSVTVLRGVATASGSPAQVFGSEAPLSRWRELVG